MNDNIVQKLEQILSKHDDLSLKLSSTEVIEDYKKMIEYNKLYKDLSETVEVYLLYKKTKNDKTLLKSDLEKEEDDEMRDLIKEELVELDIKEESLAEKLKVLILPKDSNDDKNVIIEIRAGAGGEEAAIFVSDLFRMYSRFAEKNNWETKMIYFSNATAGGMKEVIFLIEGRSVYSNLKFESGTHRVQRVPKTETSGRIHTSTSTVAVLPDMEDVEIKIDSSTIRIETFRSSGAGGQHVNTTDSAVRIIHIPTNIAVSCQDERSQMQNREKAMKVLKAKVYAHEQKRLQDERDKNRKSQVGTGERSEKIRTYNFQQGRVTDHRINLTVHNLNEFLDGDIKIMTEALLVNDQNNLSREL